MNIRRISSMDFRSQVNKIKSETGKNNQNLHRNTPEYVQYLVEIRKWRENGEIGNRPINPNA